jgi:hypothetical protein
MRSIEIPTKQFHLQFIGNKFSMRLLRGVYIEPVEVLATPAAFAGAMTDIIGVFEMCTTQYAR